MFTVFDEMRDGTVHIVQVRTYRKRHLLNRRGKQHIVIDSRISEILHAHTAPVQQIQVYQSTGLFLIALMPPKSAYERRKNGFQCE